MAEVLADTVVRTICFFAKRVSATHIERLRDVAEVLEALGVTVQTQRLCVLDSNDIDPLQLERERVVLALGACDRRELARRLDRFKNTDRVSFYLDASDQISLPDVDVLFEIMSSSPRNTFNFGYGFNIRPSSPFFPCAHYTEDGFALGLQATDLARGCSSLDEWFERQRIAWRQLVRCFSHFDGFLGIDSTVAPMFAGHSSLITLVRDLCGTFANSVTTDTFLRISAFIRDENPQPVGMCGIMFPCLEDFELAREYERGEFTIERNIALALHSGLGVDTYPIGIDERPQRVYEILRLVHGLSLKHRKPMVVRFVSDGMARIGSRTAFENPYLADVVVRPL